MLIGIMSDTHGHHRAVQAAMALFDRLDVKHIVHCGDIGGTEVFDEFVSRPFSFVWGNMDRPTHGLIAYLHTVGITVPNEPPLTLKLGGKRLAVFHGYEEGFERAVDTLDVDYILHGHTHVARNEVRHGKRIINPGALHNVDRRTVATLDTEADKVSLYEIRSV